MLSVPLILASASPRRRELLKQIGLNFQVHPSQVDEPAYVEGELNAYAEDLAALKARDVSRQYPEALVVGADTIVVVDDMVLGKPVDREDAIRMLRLLSGRWHEVITAYSIQGHSRSINLTRSVTTSVHFRPLSENEIETYIATGSPFDKAGAYGIQDLSAIFVDQIKGCFYTVVGFPLADFYQTLKELMQGHGLEVQ